MWDLSEHRGTITLPRRISGLLRGTRAQGNLHIKTEPLVSLTLKVSISPALAHGCLATTRNPLNPLTVTESRQYSKWANTNITTMLRIPVTLLRNIYIRRTAREFEVFPRREAEEPFSHTYICIWIFIFILFFTYAP